MPAGRSAAAAKQALQGEAPGSTLTRGHNGVGLQNMRDRLGAIGGQIEILPRPVAARSSPPQPR